MSDRAAIAAAVACMVGALVARPLPLLVAVAVVVGALASQRAWLVVAGVAVLASCLGARSWAGLDPPAARKVAAVVTLVSDPEPIAGAVRAELRVDGARVEAWARGAAAGALYHRLSGERVRVTGALRAVPSEARARLARRHIAARLTIESAEYVSPGPAVVRVANGLRRTLLAGVASFSREQRSLFAGFVLGDDREQPAAITDDFRGSGLSHLLVVSGANVAFVLAVVGPLLRRVGLRMRLVLGMAVLLGFGLVTRWEPSVLRAIAMAAIALVAGAAGRPASSVRVLALAVAGLVLIDPMLVHSIGFLLSVGACVGIALLARPIAARVPGPRSLAAAIGVTVGAQAGVAPILVPVFGPLPLAALPANLLAVPAAAPIMVWGMTAGLVAGALPAIAAAVHVPTRLLIGWVAMVARVASRVPLGRVGLLQLGLVAVLVGAAVGFRLAGGRRVLAVATGAALAMGPSCTAIARSPPPMTGDVIASGLRVWRDAGATVMVLGEATPLDVLAGLRQRRIGRVDLLVVTSAARSTAETVDAIRGRLRPRAVLGVGATPVVAGDVVGVGGWRVAIRAGPPRLDVAVCAQGGTTVGSCG